MARSKTKKRASKKSRGRKSRPIFAYPLTIFLLICAGVFLVGWTFKASGAQVHVTAEVQGPPVTSPAVITEPTAGQHFKSVPITVSGTCPANAAYVEIYRGNVMSGTAICDSGSNFSLSVSLSPGRNDLTAHAFNITDDAGPISSTVTVYYDAPSPPSPPKKTLVKPGSLTRPPVPAPAPFVLTSAFVYKGYYAGQQVEWPLRLTGGTPPYALDVNWGDGHSDVISRGQSGDFDITHIYRAPGGYKNSYTIRINAADNSGQKAYLQFFVIVNTHTSIGLTGSIFSKPPPSLGNSLRWLWVAWPVYLVVFAMAVSYWLGEREELVILSRKGILKR